MLEEEKTDSESSCLLFEKEKRLPERMNLVCKKIYLEPPRRGIPYPMFFEILHRVGQGVGSE